MPSYLACEHIWQPVRGFQRIRHTSERKKKPSLFEDFIAGFQRQHVHAT